MSEPRPLELLEKQLAAEDGLEGGREQLAADEGLEGGWEEEEEEDERSSGTTWLGLRGRSSMNCWGKAGGGDWAEQMLSSSR